MKPETGHYKNIIGNVFPMIRIAFIHTPMYGVTKVAKDNVIDLLNKSNDEFAQYYIDGLNNGSMITIVENQNVDRYFSVGELYFIS
jgi:hypothetical protein